MVFNGLWPISLIFLLKLLYKVGETSYYHSLEREEKGKMRTRGVSCGVLDASR